MFFKKWGSLAKVQLIEKKYPQLFQTIEKIKHNKTIDKYSSETNLVSIDTISLLKSTQAISSEIYLDKLLKKLLLVLLHNAGAQRAVLIAHLEGKWFIEADGNVSKQNIYLNHSELLESRLDVPLSLIKYTIRTEEMVLIQSANELDNFVDQDPYLLRVMPQSVLILPVFYQGSIQSILYLENANASHTFSSEHLNVLQILASQSAISLENARLYHKATHDPLTGLANRNLLYQMFNSALDASRRFNKMIAILFIDLDYFKKINDTLGHDVGDKLLIFIAEQLKKNLRDTDIAARLGGDEFIVMMSEVTSINQVQYVAQRFLEKLSNPVYLLGHEVRASASVGISLYPMDGSDIHELTKQADIALYHAKAAGRCNYQFYSPTLNDYIRQENAREIELREAIEQEQLLLYYQPVYDKTGKKISYFEALIRWNHQKEGILSAQEIIPLAEKCNLIIPIGEWVIRKACDHINHWISLGIKPCPIAINISAAQFKDQYFSKMIEDILLETHVAPEYIELELTESIFIKNFHVVKQEIVNLKKQGITITIDDFGAHYSSFAYLKHFSFDKIKIDQMFIEDLLNTEQDKILINAMISMGHHLNLTVIAEGVEQEAQMHVLKQVGIDGLQGYFLGYPQPFEEATELLMKYQHYQIHKII